MSEASAQVGDTVSEVATRTRVCDSCESSEGPRPNSSALRSCPKECAAAAAISRVAGYDANAVPDFLDTALHEALALTGSKFGYIYHYMQAERLFVLHAWSRGVMDACRVLEPQRTYELGKTGCWGEVVRQRRSIILNDYSADDPTVKGLPAGHVEINRWMSVPIFVAGEIVAVAGVANKLRPYTEDDARRLSVLMEAVWALAEELRARQTLARERENVRRVTAAFAKVGHAERKRLAQVLHDRVSQPLAAAGIRLKLASRERKEGEPSENLQVAMEIVEQTLAASRQVTQELSPQLLHELGLPAALSWLAHDAFADRLACSAEGPTDLGVIDTDVAAFMFDAARLLLDNVATYADTVVAHLSWSVERGMLSLSVQDEGRGWDAVDERASDEAYDGYGLWGLNEQAACFGGKLVTESAPGEGTRVSVIVPVS